MALCVATISALFVAAPAGAVATSDVEDDTTAYDLAEASSHTRASIKAALLQGMPGAATYETTFGDFVAAETAAAPYASAAKKRSIGAAFGLSAVVPGLGQAYNRQWGKAVTAFALEAAIITAAIVWNHQGNNLEQDYQQFAHGFWSPSKYARWLNDYSDFIEVPVTQIEIPGNIDFQNPGSWSDQDWNTVQAFFDQIQGVERQMYHIETGAAFSHTLPYFSEQQYYELIGKYYQFAPGWNDYPDWTRGDGTVNEAIDPSMTGADGESRPNVSDNFFQYADDHGHANDVLRRASRITGLLILTHLASAVDAAVSAKLHNDRITPDLEISAGRDGAIQPTARLTFTF